MHKDKNMDDKIKKLLNQDEIVPNSISNKKQNAFNMIRDMEKEKMTNKKKSLNKKIIAVATIVIVGGVSIASPALADVRELLFRGRYRGVQDAIENGYEQNIEGSYSESNGIKLEVIKAVADPTMINLKFKISSSDINKIQKFRYSEDGSAINIFNITDDRNRVIQFNDEEGTGTKPIIDENGNEKWLVSGGDESVDISDIGNGNVYFDIILTSSEGNLEGIKGLTLQTDRIANLKGNWKLNVEFDEDMISNEVVNYMVSEENEKIEILEAKGMATGIKIKFIVNSPIDESILLKTKLVDNSGVEYRSDRPALMVVENGKDLVEITFEANKFDNLEGFDFVIEDLGGKDEVVKLIKE